MAIAILKTSAICTANVINKVHGIGGRCSFVGDVDTLPGVLDMLLTAETAIKCYAT
jgi:hypothetical protein